MSGFSFGITTLLLFQLGATTSDIEVQGGVIPSHGPSPSIVPQILSTRSHCGSTENAELKQNFCFAVPYPGDVDRWDEHLQALDVRILGRMDWERGGKSVYFEDLDGHVGEIGSRGIWAHY